jgi:hypothetical protein
MIPLLYLDLLNADVYYFSPEWQAGIGIPRTIEFIARVAGVLIGYIVEEMTG